MIMVGLELLFVVLLLALSLYKYIAYKGNWYSNNPKNFDLKTIYFVVLISPFLFKNWAVFNLKTTNFGGKKMNIIQKALKKNGEMVSEVYT